MHQKDHMDSKVILDDMKVLDIKKSVSFENSTARKTKSRFFSIYIKVLKYLFLGHIVCFNLFYY